MRGEREYEITNQWAVRKANTDRVLRRREGISLSSDDPRCSRLAYRALCSADRVLLQSEKKKGEKSKVVNTVEKACTKSWNGRLTVIARQMCFLTVYTSPVGLFLLHNWFGDTERVEDVSALALDGCGCHCRRHSLVLVSRGDDGVRRGMWKDVCRRRREGW